MRRDLRAEAQDARMTAELELFGASPASPSPVPFAPALFTNPVLAPQAVTLSRRAPYVAPSEYISAPTAMSTNLVPGGSAAQQTAELYNVLQRASDWADQICFHGPDGTLAASPTTDAGWVRPKPSGALWLQCNMKPITAVLGVSLGPAPSQLTDIGDADSGNLSIDGTLIILTRPSGFYTQPFSPTSLTLPTSRTGQTYVAWTYIAGFAHCSLAASVPAGATTITVQSAVPGGASPYGIFPGTQLTIRDVTSGTSGVESVIVSGVSGSTLQLASPLLYAHTVPAAPDYIAVTALPAAIQQAVISLASCLIKTRGTMAMTMPTSPGGAPGQQSLIQAGGLEDFDVAKKLLAPYTTIYRRATST